MNEIADLIKDVLYLLIVNMPSDDELAAAKEALELQRTNSEGGGGRENSS
jgi:hypothetical protein